MAFGRRARLNGRQEDSCMGELDCLTLVWIVPLLWIYAHSVDLDGRMLRWLKNSPGCLAGVVSTPGPERASRPAPAMDWILLGLVHMFVVPRREPGAEGDLRRVKRYGRRRR